jgi:hypothetical protein
MRFRVTKVEVAEQSEREIDFERACQQREAVFRPIFDALPGGRPLLASILPEGWKGAIIRAGL